MKIKSEKSVPGKRIVKQIVKKSVPGKIRKKQMKRVYARKT